MSTDSRQIRPFADFLQELNDGESHDELSVEFNRLVEAVSVTGKVGTITFVVKVAPAGRNNGNTVMVTDKITVKSPEPSRSETVWFVDADGNCVRHNPAQTRMPLREVPGVGIVVDAETGEVTA